MGLLMANLENDLDLLNDPAPPPPPQIKTLDNM